MVLTPVLVLVLVAEVTAVVEHCAPVSCTCCSLVEVEVVGVVVEVVPSILVLVY